MVILDDIFIYVGNFDEIKRNIKLANKIGSLSRQNRDAGP